MVAHNFDVSTLEAEVKGSFYEVEASLLYLMS